MSIVPVVLSEAMIVVAIHALLLSGLVVEPSVHLQVVVATLVLEVVSVRLNLVRVVVVVVLTPLVLIIISVSLLEAIKGPV